MSGLFWHSLHMGWKRAKLKKLEGKNIFPGRRHLGRCRGFPPSVSLCSLCIGRSGDSSDSLILFVTLIKYFLPGYSVTQIVPWVFFVCLGWAGLRSWLLSYLPTHSTTSVHVKLFIEFYMCNLEPILAPTNQLLICRQPCPNVCVGKFRNRNVHWQAVELSEVTAKSSLALTDAWRCWSAFLLWLQTICTEWDQSFLSVIVFLHSSEFIIPVTHQTEIQMTTYEIQMTTYGPVPSWVGVTGWLWWRKA